MPGLVLDAAGRLADACHGPGASPGPLSRTAKTSATRAAPAGFRSAGQTGGGPRFRRKPEMGRKDLARQRRILAKGTGIGRRNGGRRG
ncbi:hypothetical protein DF186_17815, partial [Enterococcus hirae]